MGHEGVIFKNSYDGCDLELYADEDAVNVAALDIVEGVNHTLTREEAIEAAKAILKHYDIDFNAYEDNVMKRYRPTTSEEFMEWCVRNPNMVSITLDPDAPLTSELQYNYKDTL